MKPNRPTREAVTTINRDGSRFFLHPADVTGLFTSGRRIVAAMLIIIYVSLPWIQINNHPAVFLDVLHRRFHLFGLSFATQDLWMTFFLISGLGFTLFFVTSLLGRIWCGWACPQTVFLEHVYRRIERLIEGNASKRKQLDKRPFDAEKLTKRIIKHSIFVGISAFIAHIFLAYFISIPELYQWITHNPAQHWGAFIFVLTFTGIMYLNFSWFREQLCLIVCPYGRLQSALIDEESLIIGYDEKRGEPRGPPRKEGFGDCINCFRCVQVCPTGIDIRQGLQIECIGCANCIDACDQIMMKLNRPKGLVRYDSQSGLVGKKRHVIRPRLFIYAALMLAGLTAFGLSALQLSNANMSIVRMTGAPYFLTEDVILNQFMIRIINKTNEPRVFTIQTAADDQNYKVEGMKSGVSVPAMGEEVRPLVMSIPLDEYKGRFVFEMILLTNGEEAIIREKAEFLGPDPDKIKKTL
ncbi:MAG: cytochrome c oxidase accessory protein CcoG [Verrucomicrobiota bacterium]